MKKFLFVLIVPVLLTSCFATEPEANISREEILKALHEFDQGWKNKDSQRVDQVLHNDYVYFTPSGGTFSRDSIVATAASDQYQLKFMQRLITDIRIDGNTALVITKWNGKGSYRDVPFDDMQRCSITITKIDGKVSIMSEHCSSIRYKKDLLASSL